jgi:hypothetical protein
MAAKRNEIGELERQLETLTGEVAAALTEADGLHASRQSVLINGTDADLANHDAAFSAAQRKRERAAARLEDVESRLAQARANRADVDRAAARKDAEASAVSTADAIRNGYADMGKIVAVLKELAASATAKIGNVNRTKGDGEDEIASIASRVFASRTQPREVLSEAVVELWVFETSGSVVPDQTNIRTQGGDRGIFYADSVQGRTPHAVLLKKFRRREFLAERRHTAAGDVLAMLKQIEALTALTYEDTRSPEIEMIPLRDDNAQAA